jgi:hypothetical protein
MGADAKRKEMRKRKFGHLENTPAESTRSKKSTEPPASKEIKEKGSKRRKLDQAAEDLKETEVLQAELDSEAQEVEEPSTLKSSRFVCFIGLFMDNLFTVKSNECRKSSIHSNYRVNNKTF